MRAFRHRHHHFVTPTRLTTASTTAPPAVDRRWFSPPVHGRRRPPTRRSFSPPLHGRRAANRRPCRSFSRRLAQLTTLSAAANRLTALPEPLPPFLTSLDVGNNRRSIARRGRRATWTVTRSHEERSVWGATPSLRDRAFGDGRPSPRSRGAPSSSSLEAAQSSRTCRAPPSSSLTQSNPLARAPRATSL